MRRVIIGVLIISFGLLLKSCNTTEPPSVEQSINLKLEDVSCTEAWITLITTNLQLPATITLIQDTVTQDIILSNADTLLYIDALLPNTNYQYQASSIPQGGGQHPVTSNELSVTTMDTTSHDFTFETFTFGGTAGSSVLYDCAIITPDNIWCVGEIYVADTSQNGYTMFNATHWDGNEWEMKRILYDGGIWTITTIFAVDPDNIWFSAFIKYDGQDFIEYPIPQVLTGWKIKKIWGSINDLFVVGDNGNIVLYNGSTWRKLESGTDVNINDVYGTITQPNDRRKVFCAVSYVLQSGEHKILTIDEKNKVDSLEWNTGRRVNSTWTYNGRIIYTSGGGVFNNKAGRWNEETSIPLYYTNRIRGNALNDIFVGGDFGLLAHFNGMTWRVYEEFLFVASSLSITFSEDVVVAVGREGGMALIILGKRK